VALRVSTIITRAIWVAAPISVIAPVPIIAPISVDFSTRLRTQGVVTVVVPGVAGREPKEAGDQKASRSAADRFHEYLQARHRA
jgi:hypothetical protein